jgi:glutamate mutase epsilon subunit
MNFNIELKELVTKLESLTEEADIIASVKEIIELYTQYLQSDNVNEEVKNKINIILAELQTLDLLNDTLQTKNTVIEKVQKTSSRPMQ